MDILAYMVRGCLVFFIGGLSINHIKAWRIKLGSHQSYLTYTKLLQQKQMLRRGYSHEQYNKKIEQMMWFMLLLYFCMAVVVNHWVYSIFSAVASGLLFLEFYLLFCQYEDLSTYGVKEYCYLYLDRFATLYTSVYYLVSLFFLCFIF